MGTNWQTARLRPGTCSSRGKMKRIHPAHILNAAGSQPLQEEEMFSLEHRQMQFHSPRTAPAEGRWKPALAQAPSCPRCDSPNTKFCYYNNYSLAQPRYLCKGCRRYWTRGGSLRNVPVGGGSRKNRRGKSLQPRQLTSGGLRRPGRRGQEDMFGNQQRSDCVAGMHASFFSPELPLPRLDELHAVEFERGFGKSDTTVEGTGFVVEQGSLETLRLPAAGGGVEADDKWDVFSMNWEAEVESMSHPQQDFANVEWSSYIMDP